MTRPSEPSRAEQTASLSFGVRTDPSTGSEAPSDGVPGMYLDEIFEEIAALPRSDQEAALARRCAGHPTIEAEVRALLEVADPEPLLSGGTLNLQPGAVLNRYRLEKQLGAGATASVWMAFDLHLHAYTALKLLHPDGQIRGPMALDAVLREARAASGIISDHVVRVKTAGRFRDGPHFVDMELCAEHEPDRDGREVLEVGKALSEVNLGTVDEIVRVVAEAARGVDAAHRVGVMHRDLKPGNILLTPVSRRAKVTDFGLAADQLFPEPTEGTPATATVTVSVDPAPDGKGGRIVGTPAYMAPEQSVGHPPTRACDVYALGATLYGLLAGRPPYLPDGRHAIEALDVLHQVREGPPKPIRQVAPRVPRRVAKIVAKAMARSPRHRYATAADLARDLERWNARRKTSVDSWSPFLGLSLYVQRNRELALSLATMAVILVLFAGAVGWLRVQYLVLAAQSRQLQTQIEVAQTRRAEAERLAAEAEAVRDRTLAEKEEALRQKLAAEEASRVAAEGQSEAEAQARVAFAARLSAEHAQFEAESARDTMQTERDAAVEARIEAELRVAAAERAQEEAVARADEEMAKRRVADQRAEELAAALAEAEARAEQSSDGWSMITPTTTEPGTSEVAPPEP